MKKIKIVALVGAIFLLGLGIYFQLGGFNKVGFSIEDREDLKLIGLTYRGTPQDESMGNTFRRIELLITKYAHTNLHTIYYSEPAGKLDTLQVFVGFEQGDYPDIPEDLEVVVIECNQVILADIQAHKLVMPAPSTVKNGIEAFAKEHGEVTQGIYVDKIIDKGQVVVIAPLK